MSRKGLGTPPDVHAAGHAASWVRRETLESLAEVNRRCLELLAAQALMPETRGPPALRQIGELWLALDERARRRVSACPYLLVDACFGDPQRWQWLSRSQVADGQCRPYASFFTVPQTATVARMVFVYAWSLVNSHSDGARVVLGMHPHCADFLAACTVPQVHELAECYSAWLRPRWLRRVSLWRQMLIAASEDDDSSLVHSRMQGLQLLAAAAWDAARSVKGID